MEQPHRAIHAIESINSSIQFCKPARYVSEPTTIKRLLLTPIYQFTGYVAVKVNYADLRSSKGARNALSAQQTTNFAGEARRARLS